MIVSHEVKKRQAIYIKLISEVHNILCTPSSLGPAALRNSGVHIRQNIHAYLLNVFLLIYATADKNILLTFSYLLLCLSTL